MPIDTVTTKPVRGKRTGAKKKKKINPPPVFLKGRCLISSLVLYVKKEGRKKRKLKVISQALDVESTAF